MGNPFETLGVSGKCTQDELHKAYRNLARRWHPDRFMEGPEREWALQHMTEINAAYAECTAILKGAQPIADNDAHLDSIYTLIAAKRFSEARKALLRCETRCARWNYLFGLVLQHQGEVSKALTYFNLAARQAPDNAEYRRAKASAEQLAMRSRVDSLLDSLRSRIK